MSLHSNSFKKSLFLRQIHRRQLLHATRLSRSCWVSSDTRHHRLEASLRLTRLQGVLEIGPARLLAAMLGGLLYECVFDTLLFSSSYRPVGKTSFSSRRYSTHLFFFFGPSYRPSCPPRCSDTTHECISDAL
jgi:hypothetical protein